MIQQGLPRGVSSVGTGTGTPMTMLYSDPPHTLDMLHRYFDIESVPDPFQ